MTKKQSFSTSVLCICLCLVLTFFCSCSSAPETNTEKQTDDTVAQTDALTQAQTEALSQTESETNKEIRDWDGAGVRVLCAQADAGEDIFFSSDSPSEYSQLVMQRNEQLERLYGIKLTQETVADVCGYIKESKNAMNSPEIVYATGSGGMSELMLYGTLEDLYSHKEQAFGSAGVSVSVLRQLSVYGKLYMITGAPIRSSVESTAVMAYNKQKMASMGYEDGYLERLVLDGRWTFDRMHTLIKEHDGTDLSGASDTLYYMWKGMGALTVEKLPGDIPSVSVYNAKNIYYFERVQELYSQTGEISTDSSALFYADTMGAVARQLGSNTSVLPMPSYHEGGDYSCVLDFGSTFFTAVPRGGENIELSLAFLEGLYSLSIDTVYADTVEEYTFDDDQMLDIILKSRYFDFLDMYGIGHIMKTAFSANAETADFDKLLQQRASFASQALDIALKQTVGENLNTKG